MNNVKSLLAGLGTIDPRWFSFLAAIRIACLVLGSVLVDQHLEQTGLYHVIMAIGGSIITLGSAAWGIYASFMGLWKAQAVGVQAGINMTTAGAAVDTNNQQIATTMPNGAPVKPVTLQTTRAIVQDYGPSPNEIGKG